MQVKVNKSELEILTDKIDNNAANLLNEIDNCLKCMDNISEAYKSIESPQVIDKFIGYIDYLKIIPYTYNDMNNLIKKAHNIYDEEDTAFMKELQRENEEIKMGEEYGL